MTPSPTDEQIFVALWTFLTAILPDGIEIIRAQENRVPEPVGTNFVVMNEVRRQRLATNIDDYEDVKFTGSIAATTMTVSAVARGSITAGRFLYGTGVTANTKVVAQLTGPAGGAGTYTVSISQTVTSRTLSAGVKSVEQETGIAIQLDVHGPLSSDNAQTISTLFRDEYAVDSFAAQSPAVAVPLYTEEPRQMAFINEGQQYEDRWVVEAMLQANPVVEVPQQFADSVTGEAISVEAAYPAS